MQSIVRGGNDFPPRSRDQSGEDADVNGGLQEMHGAVGKEDVGPARVEAIDLLVVTAVDGTRPRVPGAIGSGTPDLDPVHPAGPGTTRRESARYVSARLPAFGPARGFGNENRLGGAIHNVGE